MEKAILLPSNSVPALHLSLAVSAIATRAPPTVTMRSPEQYSSSVVVVWEIGSSTRRTRWRGVGKSAPNVDETPSHATTATAVFMFPRGPRRRGYLGRRRFYKRLH